MKVHNKPAIITLPAHLSLSKNENMFYKKKKPKEKRFPLPRVEPRTSNVKGQHVIYCVTTTDNTNCC